MSGRFRPNLFRVDRLLDTVHDMGVGPHNGASTHWPELGSLALSVLLHQLRVGILGLGILVEIIHVGVRKRAGEIEIVFLHVLAVIAFISS
jgi:hypothetical protein